MLRWVRASQGKEVERAAREKGMSKGKHTEAGASMGGAGNFTSCWIAKCIFVDLPADMGINDNPHYDQYYYFYTLFQSGYYMPGCLLGVFIPQLLSNN